MSAGSLRADVIFFGTIIYDVNPGRDSLVYGSVDPGGLSSVLPVAWEDAVRSGSAARMFGVLDKETGLALRGTFIINPDGKLLSSEVNSNNVGRNIDELMRRFKAYLHVSRKTQGACPSKWKNEGDATLQPSAKLVGRVYRVEGSYA